MEFRIPRSPANTPCRFEGFNSDNENGGVKLDDVADPETIDKAFGIESDEESEDEAANESADESAEEEGDAEAANEQLQKQLHKLPPPKESKKAATPLRKSPRKRSQKT